MQTPQDAIVASLSVSLNLMRRYCADLTPTEYLHRPTPKANCAAWLLGHLILTERRALANLGVAELPQLPDGFEKRFARTDDAPSATEFGDVTTLLALFEQHRTMLIEATKRATLDTINKPLEKPLPIFSTVGEMVNFMAQHATMHAGQITIIRRSLGRPPVA
jgi:uncharacterized damage-inducible protein DinB